jgi:hypothetical protein
VPALKTCVCPFCSIFRLFGCRAQLDAVQARQAQLLALADQHGLLSSRSVLSAADNPSSPPTSGDWPAPSNMAPPLAAAAQMAEQPAAV